jgi:hypothetical protein
MRITRTRLYISWSDDEVMLSAPASGFVRPAELYRAGQPPIDASPRIYLFFVNNAQCRCRSWTAAAWTFTKASAASCYSCVRKVALYSLFACAANVALQVPILPQKEIAMLRTLSIMHVVSREWRSVPVRTRLARPQKS